MRYTPDSVDQLIASFPHASLTKITGRPTFTTMRTLFRELRENAASIHTPLGGGMNGCQGLTHTVAEYQNIAPVQWVTSVHPGPIINPNGLSATNFRNQNHFYQAALDAFIDCRNVENALKKQL